jgi:hypothetical protein
MKINDLGKVDEGAMDWLARKGVFGARAGFNAQQQQARSVAKEQSKISFIESMKDSFVDAVQSGVVNVQAQSYSQQAQTSQAQTRQQKLAAASKVANDQMNATPSPQQSQTPPSTAGQSAFGNMATGLEKMGQRAPVTTLSPGSRQLGPKGRETLARLGKQSQVRSSGNQGTLDLNENDYYDFDTLLESILSEASTGMAPSQWVKQYIAALMRVEEKDIPHPETLDNIANIFQTQIYNQNIIPSDPKSLKSMMFPEKIADQLYSYFASSASLKLRPQQTDSPISGTSITQTAPSVDRHKYLTDLLKPVINSDGASKHSVPAIIALVDILVSDGMNLQTVLDKIKSGVAVQQKRKQQAQSQPQATGAQNANT